MKHFLWIGLLVPLAVFAQKAPKPQPPVSIDRSGTLIYTSDSLGNRVPDFSYCGYAQSEKPLPFVPARIVVPVREGDATARIQAAIDAVGRMPLQADGFRGAVLLEKGRYELAGSLRMPVSGVVLRGSGAGAGGTELFAAGTDRATFIRMGGKDDRFYGKGLAVMDAYLPVNAMKLSVNSPAFKAGDRVCVRRPSTRAWILATGTERFGDAESTLQWRPGDIDLNWFRRVVRMNGSTLELSAPLTTDMNRAHAVDTVYPLQWPGLVQNIGLENLSLVSEWDGKNLKDENHRWMAVTVENAEDAWVRRVNFRHFAGSAVYALETASRITVEDCRSFQPIAEIGGFRRQTFRNDGQLNLFQRCTAEDGCHDFITGRGAAGPNAFVQCYSTLPHRFSGALGPWNSGVLFDNVRVEGQALSFADRGQDYQGAGWSAANSVFWQCHAAVMYCPQPPGAQNWAFGSWAQSQGNGSWNSSGDPVQPQSLFYGQLEARLGKSCPWAGLMPDPGEASSSPTYEVAAALSREARNRPLLLTDWIDSLELKHPISLDATGARSIDQIKTPPVAVPEKAAPMEVKNGWLVRGEVPVVGRRRGITWWRGSDKPSYLNSSSQQHITRWFPGRTGTGFTDDLDEMTTAMRKRGIVATDHHYGLWYERRRDDHIRERRMDGDVWAPFYEQPFARSGQGTAFDGLSKYDLSRWNSWYWIRLKQYADFSDQKGLILFHQNFFQHNIIEAGAHWADCPWNSANNINNPGFPVPVNYAGDKRVFVAEQFYDLQNPVRKALQRNYIRQCLDNFKDNNSVIQFIGDEFTGPKHFVTFWLDVIDEWEKETGKNALVCLSVTKDVQDSLLADARYNRIVEIIDIKYWQYEAGGKLYAPPGGKNLAPRQHQRLKNQKINVNLGNPPSAAASKATQGADLMYWMVRDYRDAYPDKAVLYVSDASVVGWPAFMAGGSVCALPTALPEAFLRSAARMKPVDSAEPERVWQLSNDAGESILYLKSGKTVDVDLSSKKGTYRLQWLNAGNGEKIGSETKLRAGSILNLEAPAKGASIAWIYQ